MASRTDQNMHHKNVLKEGKTTPLTHYKATRLSPEQQIEVHNTLQASHQMN